MHGLLWGAFLKSPVGVRVGGAAGRCRGRCTRGGAEEEVQSGGAEWEAQMGRYIGGGAEGTWGGEAGRVWDPL